MTCTIAEVARQAGCTDAAIIQARRKGRLPEELFGVNERGRTCMLDLETSVRTVRAVIGCHSQNRVDVTSDSAGVKTTGGQQDAGAAPSVLEAADDYHTSRAKREKFAADRAELDFKVRDGQLVERAELGPALFNVGRTFRDSLQQLRPRLASLLASVQSEHEIDQILAKEFDDILRSAADALQRLSTGG